MKFLGFFKLTNIKRIVIFCLMIFASLTVIIFGAVFFTGPKTVLGSEYHSSAQYVIKIKDTSSTPKSPEELAIKVAKDIQTRIDNDLNHGVLTQPEVTVDKDSTVRVTYPNVDSQAQKDAINKLITYKPNLVAVDYYSNPLFNADGNFNDKLSPGVDPGKTLIPVEDFDWEKDTKIPLKVESVSSLYETKPYLKADLKNEEAQKQWTKATDYVSKLPEEKRVVAFFLYLTEYIELAKKDWPQEWEKAQKNPYFFSFVDETPVDANKKPNNLKKYQIDASNYLISYNTKPKEAQRGPFILFQHSNPDISRSNLDQVASQINYGTANYDLSTFSSRFNPPIYSSSGFKNFLIAGAIIFALLTLFLVWNYGILGVISSLSIALIGFLTWTFFNLLGGVFTPLVIGGLIFLLAFFVDKNLVFFERIKNYSKRGDNLQKASRIAHRKTVPLIFDTHNIALMLGIGLFYFGAQIMWGFSLTLVIGVICSLLVGLLITHFLSHLLITSQFFDNHLMWLGIRNERNSRSLKTPNFFSNSKVLIYAMVAIIGLAIIIMSIFIGINKSFVGGFNLSQIFSGGSIIEINNLGNQPMSQDDFKNLVNILSNYGIGVNDITIILNPDDSSLIDLARISVNRGLDLVSIKAAVASSFNFYGANVLNSTGQTLIIGSLISSSLALLFIVAYIVFRFRWTYSLIMLSMAVVDVVLVVALFTIFRLSINYEFITALLLVLIYSMNHSIVVFSQIKTKSSLHLGTLNYDQTFAIANQSTHSTFKRSIVIGLILILLFMILGMFTNIVSLTLVYGIVFGAITSTISSLLISPLLWAKLEAKRQKWITSRVESNFWDVNEPEEQTFNGINNFKV